MEGVAEEDPEVMKRGRSGAHTEDKEGEGAATVSTEMK